MKKTIFYTLFIVSIFAFSLFYFEENIITSILVSVVILLSLAGRWLYVIRKTPRINNGPIECKHCGGIHHEFDEANPWHIYPCLNEETHPIC